MASPQLTIRIKSPVRIDGIRKPIGSIVTVRRFDALSMISAGTAELVSGDPGDGIDGDPVRVTAKAKAADKAKAKAKAADKAKAGEAADADKAKAGEE